MAKACNIVRLKVSSGNQTEFEELIDEEFEGALMLDEKLVPSRRMIPGIYFMVVQQGKGVKKHKIVIK